MLEVFETEMDKPLQIVCIKFATDFVDIILYNLIYFDKID